MKGNLDSVLKEVNWYDYAIESHNNISNMRPVYRECRKDIIDRYQLEKGEFTTLYAITRGRYNANNRRKVPR